ncbi:MAG: hypothetical protein IT210_07305 [Armatimonadetes bacterium]|nr:hypothetical protein [Armatimonadota bacterium]
MAALKLVGPLKVDTAIRADVQGHLLPKASDAALHGKTLTYQPQYDDLGYWVPADDWCEWPIQIEQAGEQEIAIE